MILILLASPKNCEILNFDDSSFACRLGPPFSGTSSGKNVVILPAFLNLTQPYKRVFGETAKNDFPKQLCRPDSGTRSGKNALALPDFAIESLRKA